MDTLSLGCILPTTRADWGLSPVRNVRRKAHITNRRYRKLLSCTAGFILVTIQAPPPYIDPESLPFLYNNAHQAAIGIIYYLLDRILQFYLTFFRQTIYFI